MKMAFLVHNEFHAPKVLALLKDKGIDYFTRWDHATGKGHGTDPHLGTGGFPSTNTVLMIAFEDEAPLAALIAAITDWNTEIKRADDKIRLFQLPLDRIV
jgi:hypothetical protein